MDDQISQFRRGHHYSLSHGYLPGFSEGVVPVMLLPARGRSQAERE
jgi:hypothetical protein